MAVIEETQLRARLFAIEEINQLGEAVFLCHEPHRSLSKSIAQAAAAK
jgi:hypothetical protein